MEYMREMGEYTTEYEGVYEEDEGVFLRSMREDTGVYEGG